MNKSSLPTPNPARQAASVAVLAVLAIACRGDFRAKGDEPPAGTAFDLYDGQRGETRSGQVQREKIRTLLSDARSQGSVEALRRATRQLLASYAVTLPATIASPPPGGKEAPPVPEHETHPASGSDASTASPPAAPKPSPSRGGSPFSFPSQGSGLRDQSAPTREDL